jgi:Uncharacterized protein conserved in bacteria (DUF2188)
MKRIKLIRKNPNNPQIKAYSRAIENGLKSQHVVPRDTGWAVKKSGAQKAGRIFDTQKDAIIFATNTAKKNKAEVFVHAKNGRIKRRITTK